MRIIRFVTDLLDGVLGLLLAPASPVVGIIIVTIWAMMKAWLKEAKISDCIPPYQRLHL